MQPPRPQRTSLSWGASVVCSMGRGGGGLLSGLLMIVVLLVGMVGEILAMCFGNRVMVRLGSGRGSRSIR